MWSQFLLVLLCSSTLWELAGKSSSQISLCFSLPLTYSTFVCHGLATHWGRRSRSPLCWAPKGKMLGCPGPVGIQLQPSSSARGKKGEDVGVELPSLPLVFAHVPGGRPGQPNITAGRCQHFTEQNCTSLFHWFCKTIKEHPEEYVTHTCLISFTVSVLIYAGRVSVKQRFIGTWNFMTSRFAWVQIVRFSFWKRRLKRAHLPVALVKP